VTMAQASAVSRLVVRTCAPALRLRGEAFQDRVGDATFACRWVRSFRSRRSPSRFHPARRDRAAPRRRGMNAGAVLFVVAVVAGRGR
jgi:hypothetical protein